MANLTDYQAESGTRQACIDVRTNALEDSQLNNPETLYKLQDVALTQAFIDLQRQQTSYQTILKVCCPRSGT